MNNMKRIFILLLITTLWGVQDNISAQQLRKENNTPEVQGIIKDITGNPIIGATVIAKTSRDSVLLQIWTESLKSK